MQQFLSRFSLIAGLFGVALTIGFLFEVEAAQQIFPWSLSHLSSIFLASIFGALSAPVLWIGYKQEIAAAVGGAINLSVTYLGMAIFCFQLYFADTSRHAILIFAIACSLLLIGCIVLYFITRNFEFTDQKQMPAAVRYSFMGFAFVLLVAGTALILKTPNIFPWALSEELRVLYGWIFLGAMFYFIYGAWKPYWGNAQGQLVGFLIYDLILIIPFIQHFSNVADEMRLSLIIYICVLIYSGLLAAYFLFINRETKFF